MTAFKVPHDIPQDLLLIHDIIGVPDTPPLGANTLQTSTLVSDDDIDSSDSGIASEDEIEASLTIVLNDEENNGPDSESSSSSGSDSEAESEESGPNEQGAAALELSDEEESGPSQVSGAHVQTKNELSEADVVVPDVTEVGQDEVLEKVGEIITIMGNTVVINGLPSEVIGRGSDRALDSETLLVFQDRKVMGYVYETFGPTSQPLYQVKFNKDFTLDPEKVRVSREVFHVPARSNFVFLNNLKKIKGSDASNIHDEEPGENELEFSDDEAEAAYKAALKRKRGLHPQSATSSRHTTPTSSRMHDQDMVEMNQLSKNPYDEHGFYDDELNAGPMRPLPIPYDDPYSESYTPSIPKSTSRDDPSLPSYQRRQKYISRGRGQARDRRDSGRRGRRDHNGPFSGESQSYVESKSNTGDNSWPFQSASAQNERSFFGHLVPRPMSPTSLAIARATGQLSDVSDPSIQRDPRPTSVTGPWGYTDSPQQGPMFHAGTTRYPQPFIQPHINPRFANALGVNMGLAPYHGRPIPYSPHNSIELPGVGSSAAPMNWTEDWSNPTGSDATM